MKKLIAMIGAVATAFGLYAATPFATSFEAADGVTGATYTPGEGWTWQGDPLTVGVYAGDKYAGYGAEGSATARRNGMFLDGENLNYLKLETGTNALSRTVGEGNLFLDQLVKFTGFEEYQTNVVAGTKIAVWMSGIEGEGTPAVPGNDEPPTIDDLSKEPDEEGKYPQIPNPNYFAGTPASDDYVPSETNLYVTVGKIDDDGNITPVKIKIDGEYKLDTWYRLTIKSLGSIFQFSNHAGFIIYVDGQQVSSSDPDATLLVANDSDMTPTAKGYMADGALFTAIDSTDATFATVGYQGIGAIDDIILDEEGPAFAQAIDVVITFPVDAEGNDAVEVDYIDVGGVHMSYPLAVPAGTQITVHFKPVAGKKIMSQLNPITLTVTANNYTIDVSDVIAEDVVAKKNGTIDLAASEMAAALAALVENDTIAFVAACEVWEEGADSCTYSFAPNTTITTTAAGWDVFVGNYDDGGECGGTFERNADIVDGFVLNVQIEDDTGDLGGTFSFAGEIAGTLKTVFGANDTIDATLVGKGKVITMDGTLDSILDGDGNAVIPTENDPEEGWYTYALATEPETTGFAIIIADADPVTTNYYKTLDAAIDAAGTTVDDVTLPSVVTILENVTIESTVVISKPVTLDATGKTVTCTAMYPFQVNGGDLTITAGTFTQNVEDGIILWAVNGGKITVNGGDFSAIPDGEIAYVQTADSLIEIYGGTFVMADKADGSKGDVLNVAQTLGLDKTDYIKVYGGSFSKDPADGDDALGPTFVADGYESVYDELTGLYSVAQSAAVAKIGDKGYPTLAAAATAAVDNDTIVLLDDYTLAIDEKVVFTNKVVTLDLGDNQLTIRGDNKDFIIATDSDVTLTNGVITGTASYGIKVDGTLTVDDIDMDANGAGPCFDMYANASITVNSGSFLNFHDVFRLTKVADATPTVVVNGGTYSTTQYGAFYVYKNNCSADITINAGTFESRMIFVGKDNLPTFTWAGAKLTDECEAKFKVIAPHEGGGVQLSDFVADGYELVRGQDGYYTIQAVYDITITAPENGTLETSVTNNILAGTEVTITATPAANYELVSITTNGTAITGNTFVMPAENVTVAATFKSTATPGVEPGAVVEAADEQDAIAKAEAMVIVPGEDDAAAEYYKGVAKQGSDGKWYVEADVNPALVTAEIKTEEEEKPIEVTATEFKAVVKDAIPGLFYGFVATEALGGTNEFAPVVSSFVRATVEGVTLTAPKGEGNAKFFKISVRAKAPVAEQAD